MSETTRRSCNSSSMNSIDFDADDCDDTEMMSNYDFDDDNDFTLVWGQL